MTKFKKIIASCLLFSATLYMSQHFSHENLKKEQLMYKIPADILLDTNDQPTPELAKLLQLCELKHDNTLPDIVKITQEYYLRQSGKERWQTGEIYHELFDQIMIQAKNLGAYYEVAPTKKHYRYALLLGATLQRVRTRMTYLIMLWQNGIRFDEIVCLGSERPLDAALENETALLDKNNDELAARSDWSFDGSVPKTEYEMIQFVYNQGNIPAQFKKIPIKFINTPMILTANGSMRRANTADTIDSWLATHPEPDSVLCISNQPYVVYQDSVVRTYLPPTFTLETVGESASPELRNAEFLDTIARTLYQEKIRRTKK